MRSLKLGAAAAALLLGAAAPPAAFGAASPLGNMPPQDNRQLAHDIFRDIIAVHSVHPVGTGGVADVLARYLIDGGFSKDDVHIVPETTYPKQVNVVVRLHGKGP